MFPGFEGMGVVAESGGGFAAWKLVGKRVAVRVDGTWAEFVVANVFRVVVLPDDMSAQQGA